MWQLNISFLQFGVIVAVAAISNRGVPLDIGGEICYSRLRLQFMAVGIILFNRTGLSDIQKPGFLSD